MTLSFRYPFLHVYNLFYHHCLVIDVRTITFDTIKIASLTQKSFKHVPSGLGSMVYGALILSNPEGTYLTYKPLTNQKFNFTLIIPLRFRLYWPRKYFYPLDIRPCLFLVYFCVLLLTVSVGPSLPNLLWFGRLWN